MKKTIMIIVVTAMITGIISIYGAYAATTYAISATKIGYSDNSNLGVDNVQAAIDGTCTKFSSQLINLKNDVKKETIDEMYPVGSIYISTSISSAKVVATTLGVGTWEAYAQGRTLIGVGTNGTTSYATNKTGGNEQNTYTIKPSGTISTYTGNSGSTTLTIDQIPSHEHNLDIWSFNGLSNPTAGTKYGLPNLSGTGSPGLYTKDVSSETVGHATATGGSQGHTHTINHTHTFSGDSSTITLSTIQPYITVYMYKRTA